MSDQRARSFNAREVADLCGVDLETVQDWVEEGELKVLEMPGGAERRVWADDLVAFLNETGQPVPLALASPAPRRRG